LTVGAELEGFENSSAAPFAHPLIVANGGPNLANVIQFVYRDHECCFEKTAREVIFFNAIHTPSTCAAVWM
jgi:hypothetical protein